MDSIEFMKAMITYPCSVRVDALVEKLIPLIVVIDNARAEAKKIVAEMAPCFET
jgi:hypothetical protein